MAAEKGAAVAVAAAAVAVAAAAVAAAGSNPKGKSLVFTDFHSGASSCHELFRQSSSLTATLSGRSAFYSSASEPRHQEFPSIRYCNVAVTEREN